MSDFAEVDVTEQIQLKSDEFHFYCLILMKSRRFKIIQLLVSISLLIFVVNKIGLDAILHTFESIELAYLPVVIFLYLITLILGGINLWILLRSMTKGIPLFRIVIYSIVSWSVGLFTPGKIGEFSVAYLLKKDGLEVGKGVAVALVDKFITLSTLIICSGIGTFVVIGRRYTLFFSIALVSLFIAVFLLIFCIKKINSRNKFLWLRNFQSAMTGYFRHSKGLLCINCCLTMVKWCITGLAFYMIFASLGSPANVVLIIVISMTITIINIIPITLHGLGLKEVASVYLYGFIGIPQEVAMVSSLFFSMLAYAVGLIFFFLLGSHFQQKS